MLEGCSPASVVESCQVPLYACEGSGCAPHGCVKFVRHCGPSFQFSTGAYISRASPDWSSTVTLTVLLQTTEMAHERDKNRRYGLIRILGVSDMKEYAGQWNMSEQQRWSIEEIWAWDTEVTGELGTPSRWVTYCLAIRLKSVASLISRPCYQQSLQLDGRRDGHDQMTRSWERILMCCVDVQVPTCSRTFYGTVPHEIT